MGDLIHLAALRATRRTRATEACGPAKIYRLNPRRRAGTFAAPPSAPPAFVFDVADPATYLLAERVQRALPGIAWIPAAGAVDYDVAWLERRASALRLPLVFPERWPHGAEIVRRAAHAAAEQGGAARFALAAGRLAYGGGFDLDDPELLEAAATASGLDVAPILAAAIEDERDDALARATAGRLPALRAGGRLIAGEDAVARALAAVRYEAAAAVR